MPTTTNYGWTTPADTDLVKDGASAIRTLGTAIDTTVFNNASAGIPKTIVDAKGDLIAATAADTVARLAIGSNDTVLTADSSTATGLKWATSAAGGMTLISTTTLTGASVTLSSIPQTYNDLVLIFQNAITVTDGDPIYMRVNGDSNASRHRSVQYVDVPQTNAFNLTRWTVSPVTDQSTGTGLVQFNIPNYTNATTWKIAQSFGAVNDGTTPTSSNIIGFVHAYNQTGAISSFTIFANTGNFTSGTVLLYGVK